MTTYKIPYSLGFSPRRNYTSDFSQFFSRKIASRFFAFSRKNSCKKVRKKSGLKTLLLAKIGRKFTDFLEESTNFCPLPQSVSKMSLISKVTIYPYIFMHPLKKETFKKGHLLPIYGITYFSHFFALSRKIVLFFRFSRKK